MSDAGSIYTNDDLEDNLEEEENNNYESKIDSENRDFDSNTLYDYELARTDLLNAFYIKKGEKFSNKIRLDG